MFGAAGSTQGNILQKGNQVTVQGLPVHTDLTHTAAWPLKREECRCNLLPLRAPHLLIKGGQQRVREAAVPGENFFSRGSEPPGRDLVPAQRPGQQRGRRVGKICSQSVHLTD